MFNQRLPSYKKYSNTGMTDSLTLNKYVTWYLGIIKKSAQIANILSLNYHVDLLNKPDLKEKFSTYMDVDIIPETYKIGKSYYDDYEKEKIFIFPKLKDTNLFKKDQNLIDNLTKLLTTDISPGLADLNSLKGLPKALILVCECDMSKGEGLIYAERMRMANVDVKTKFYEEGFHGALTLNKFFKVSEKMRNDIIDYLKDNI